MSLLPYFDHPLRLLERNFFGPDLYSPHNSEGLFSPSYLKPWEMALPLERLSEAVNHLALNKSTEADDTEKFEVNVDVQHFAPQEINVKVINGQVIVEGKHEEKRDQHGYISRRFVRKYSLPKGCLPDTVQSKLSSDGVLTVTAPKVLAMPSTGEKIIPITKTGPVRKQISAADFIDASSESAPKQAASVEEK